MKFLKCFSIAIFFMSGLFNVLNAGVRQNVDNIVCKYKTPDQASDRGRIALALVKNPAGTYKLISTTFVLEKKDGKTERNVIPDTHADHLECTFGNKDHMLVFCQTQLLAELDVSTFEISALSTTKAKYSSEKDEEYEEKTTGYLFQLTKKVIPPIDQFKFMFDPQNPKRYIESCERNSKFDFNK